MPFNIFCGNTQQHSYSKKKHIDIDVKLTWHYHIFVYLNSYIYINPSSLISEIILSLFIFIVKESFKHKVVLTKYTLCIECFRKFALNAFEITWGLITCAHTIIQRYGERHAASNAMKVIKESHLEFFVLYNEGRHSCNFPK